MEFNSVHLAGCIEDQCWITLVCSELIGIVINFPSVDEDKNRVVISLHIHKSKAFEVLTKDDEWLPILILRTDAWDNIPAITCAICSSLKDMYVCTKGPNECWQMTSTWGNSFLVLFLSPFELSLSLEMSIIEGWTAVGWHRTNPLNNINANWSLSS